MTVAVRPTPVGLAHSPPLLSVVVASPRRRAVLDACLASLVPQCEAQGAELLVARAEDSAGTAALAAAYPGARVVAAGVGADIPRLRGAGLAAAGGEFVLLTEDHCVPAPDWVATLGAHARTAGADVVGGGMDNGRRTRAIDWGAYFSEYGFFDAHSAGTNDAEGGRRLITGANVAYARRVVGAVAAWMRDGAWENVVHDRLAAAGGTLHFEPAARVAQDLHYEFGPFVRDRYEHGRDYARARLRETGAGGRWLRAATTPLLPAVLTWRVARGAAGARPQAFARALPFTVAFLAAWAAGELTGYVRGAAR